MIAFRLVAAVWLVAFLAAPQTFAPLFAVFVDPDVPVIYDRAPLVHLALAHLLTVGVATAACTCVAVALGVLVTRPGSAEFLPLSRSLANIGYTIPPVAVLALAVPLVGFGEAPVLLALFLYGLLPVFETGLAGLLSVPSDVKEAARGMGMTESQVLWRVELPLSLPLILAGVRIATVINLATATIGATVASKGLGEVIIAGLQGNNLGYVVQGALLVAVLAVLINDWFGIIERQLAARMGRIAGADLLR